jgi:hypothetical protein
MAKGILLLAQVTLGLGLGGWLVAGGLAIASWIARRNPTQFARLALWERRAVAWAMGWLVVGLLSGAWASQAVWGRAWRWMPGEDWTLVAALATVAYAQTAPGRWRRLILVAGVAATLLALWAGALTPGWPH